MTDGIEKEVDRKAISEGASDYLIKDDITADSLERTIRYSIERKKIDRHLDHLAHYDSLTSIPNRVLFQDRLNQAVSLGHRSKHPFTLMYIDLNDFKEINDSYGHNVGDQLLQQFATRLQSVVRSSDTVARIGGDEFTVLLNNLGSTPQVIQLAQKLLDSMAEPFFLEGNQLMIGCSIGLAVFPDAGDSSEKLQKNADIAMYQAKKTGSSCYRFFSNQHKDGSLIENIGVFDLKNEIDQGNLSIRFSPRLNIKTGKIETLNIDPIWNHKELSGKTYYDFLNDLNNKESIKFLTHWMISETLPYFCELNKKYSVSFSYAIRRSQLQSLDFGIFFRKALKKYKIKSSDIELAFLPNKISEDMFCFSECLENINDLGAKVGVCDFEMSALSIADIVQYDIYSLIFSAFSSDSKECKVIADAYINLAHRMKRKVTINHVSNKEQLKAASLLGCDYVQGEVVGVQVGYEALLDLLNNSDVMS